MNLVLVLVLSLICGPFVFGAVVPLQDPEQLDLKNVLAATTSFKGRTAAKLVETVAAGDGGMAVIRNRTFRNGVIEVDLAGAPSASAGVDARGFVGLAFRVQKDGSHFERFYIRPTNGRAADQLRRNHSTQYVSHPDWPWERLRKESPGVYESYADLAASGLISELSFTASKQDFTLANRHSSRA